MGKNHSSGSNLSFKIYFLVEMGEKVEVSAVTGLSLHTRWVGKFGHLVQVTPKEDEAGAHAEEHQSSPEADVVKGLPHAHPVGQLLGKGQAQAESKGCKNL